MYFFRFNIIEKGQKSEKNVYFHIFTEETKGREKRSSNE